MSEQAKRALGEAIAAHVEDEAGPGNVVTGYALIASHSTADDFDEEITRYLTDYADRPPFHVGLGLIHRHLMIHNAGVND